MTRGVLYAVTSEVCCNYWSRLIAVIFSVCVALSAVWLESTESPCRVEKYSLIKRDT